MNTYFKGPCSSTDVWILTFLCWIWFVARAKVFQMWTRVCLCVSCGPPCTSPPWPWWMLTHMVGCNWYSQHMCTFSYLTLCKSAISYYGKCNTLLPRYITVSCNTISDTTQFFLGPQIIFKGLADRKNSSILPTSHLKMLDLYKYGRILTKIFTSVEKIRRDKHSGD